jgi:hypothetical protein
VCIRVTQPHGRRRAGALGLLLILRMLCLAREHRRGGPAPSEQLIVPQHRADPLYAPPTVPVQVSANWDRNTG